MSSKADTLFNKATTFEKLALFGNRKSFLQSLAQTNLPDVNALLAAVTNAKKQLVSAVTQFWTQNPQAVPQAAREAYSALRYPQDDITSATGAQLNSALDQLSVAANSIYKALANSNGAGASFAATLFPLVENITNSVNAYKQGVGTAETSNPSDQATQLPQTNITGRPRSQVNVSPNDLESIQNFLNQDLINEMPPITPDGIWGTETSGRIQYWAKKNKITQPLSRLIDMLKARATGNQVANSFGPGVNFQNSKNSI